MKLIDANILLYAYNSDSVHHLACRDWLESAFNDGEPLALPWQSILAFIRIATNPRAAKRPLDGAQACQIVAGWLSHPNVVVTEPATQFWGHLRALIAEAQVVGPLVTDAALAALALELGAVLCSTDRDFRRFKGLKTLDPTTT